MGAHKGAIRFTFDCPEELHTLAKIKASALRKSMKDYFIGLLAKDVAENSPKFLDNKAFKKELNRILEEDANLMKKLADR